MAKYASYRFGFALACTVVVAYPLSAQAEPSDLPERFAPAIVAASSDPSAAAELLYALPSTLLPADLIELQQLDRAWFDERHPELPPPTLPVDSPTSRYKYADVLEMLRGERGANGNPQQGAAVFEKAQCIKCHRFGTRGEAMGPDLSNTQQWLQRKQFLEATMFPSQSITDQYETTTIITTGGQIFSGVLAAADGMIVVLQANGEKVRVNRDEIDETVPSRKSAMPDGLLDPLSLDEIADLFAYLRNRQP